MFSNAPIGLIPEHFRRRPATPAAPVVDPLPAENDALPEPVDEPARGAVFFEGAHVWPPRRLSAQTVEALRGISDALRLPAGCVSRCCVRAKRCLWAGGGRCMHGRREQIQSLIKGAAEHHDVGPGGGGQAAPSRLRPGGVRRQ